MCVNEAETTAQSLAVGFAAVAPDAALSDISRRGPAKASLIPRYYAVHLVDSELAETWLDGAINRGFWRRTAASLRGYGMRN